MRGAVILAAAAMLVVAACTAGGPAATGGTAIPVLGTENFYADLLTQIGGAPASAAGIPNNPNPPPPQFEASTPPPEAVAGGQLVILDGHSFNDIQVKTLRAPDKTHPV